MIFLDKNLAHNIPEVDIVVSNWFAKNLRHFGEKSDSHGAGEIQPAPDGFECSVKLIFCTKTPQI